MEDQSDMLFVTWKMGPAVAVSNDTIVSWLKETLTLANIRASGGSTRKAATTYVASQGTLIRAIMEAGDWAHSSMMYWHYIRCLPKEVLVRILEYKHQLAFKGWMWQRKPKTTNADEEHYAGRLGHHQSHLKDSPQVIFWTELRNYNLSQYMYFSHFLWEIWLHSVIMNI